MEQHVGVHTLNFNYKKHLELISSVINIFNHLQHSNHWAFLMDQELTVTHSYNLPVKLLSIELWVK